MLEIANKAKIEYFDKNKKIIKENTPSNDKMYVVLEGEVDVLKIKPESQEKYGERVNSLGVGKMFGEVALLNDQPVNHFLKIKT